MRLDRFLSHAAGLSRSQAQRAIRAGEVRVAGAVVTDPGAHVEVHGSIELAGRSIEARKPRYLMLHKPAGCVCATEDREHRTVLDLLDAQNPSGLHVAGRLDIDATGLVLITDDGEWSHRVTSPRHKVPKTYRVTLEKPLSDEAATKLRAGVALRNEPRHCAPAELERVAGNVWRLSITEGKYHQVKRMFAAVGSRVLALHRERIGKVALDPDLAPGEYRRLTVDEIAAFRRPAP
jgi:16S rRNA pseudouridine516 synthase